MPALRAAGEQHHQYRLIGRDVRDAVCSAATTSKAAVIGMTRGLARELGRDNIRVNAVAPSAVITEGTREFFANKLDKALWRVSEVGQAIQRNLQPSDLSGTISQWPIRRHSSPDRRSLSMAAR